MDATLAILTTFLAGFVYGGIGYGYSSISVPVMLLVYTNRILNPALVAVETGSNLFLLFHLRKSIHKVWRRLVAVIVGLIPAVIVGSFFLESANTSTLKIITYTVLAPLILLQAFGLRIPLGTNRSKGLFFGAGVGLLYSTSTISGPPLAIALNNEGYSKEDFRTAMALIRSVESAFTLCAYLALGLLVADSINLFLLILPGTLVGTYLGSKVFRHLQAGHFRRLCITVDVWLIAFGLTQVLYKLNLASPATLVAVFSAIIAVDLYGLTGYFRLKKQMAAAESVLNPFRTEALSKAPSERRQEQRYNLRLQVSFPNCAQPFTTEDCSLQGFRLNSAIPKELWNRTVKCEVSSLDVETVASFHVKLVNDQTEMTRFTIVGTMRSSERMLELLTSVARQQPPQPLQRLTA